MSPEEIRASLPRVAEALPKDSTWGVTSSPKNSYMFFHDRREHANSLVMETLASQFGNVLAIASIPCDDPGSEPVVACLVHVPRPPTDVVEQARRAYEIACRNNSGDG